MTRRIYNIKALTEALGTTRQRINSYINEGRMKYDYIDTSGQKYWKQSTVERYKEIMKLPAKKGSPRRFE